MYCPHPQRYSRCPSCQNVAFGPRGHTNGCRDSRFISRMVPQNSVVACKLAISLRLMFVRDMEITSITGQTSLTEMSFLVRSKNLVISGKDNNNIQILSLPVSGGSGSLLAYCSGFQLIVTDEELNSLFQLYVSEHELCINGIAKLTRTGMQKETFEMPRTENDIKIMGKSTDPKKMGITINFLGRTLVIIWYADRPLELRQAA